MLHYPHTNNTIRSIGREENQVKDEQTDSNDMASSTNKTGENIVAKSRGLGSPFKCIRLSSTQ